MKHIKSERLKKLELELRDLEQWLRLGLVPKKDIDKHKEEIQTVQSKIGEEKERLQFLKESGDVEEYIAPKRQVSRTGYTEMPTIPDIDVTATAGNHQDTGFDVDAEPTTENTVIEERENDEETTTTTEEHDDSSYFSRRNRWHRSGILDPDADEW